MLSPFIKEATQKTPYVHFDPSEGLIEIKGKATPENGHVLFDPMLNWLEAYSDNPSAKTNVNIHLEYFNTVSSKFILDIFKKLDTLYSKDNETIVQWICDKDDEDMIEAGEDYQALVNFPMRIIEAD